MEACFTPLQTYKVLKPFLQVPAQVLCFTPLQTYKVLKLSVLHPFRPDRFTPLQTYKVLKPKSNRLHEAAAFYTITNLQGSQT